MLGIKEIEYNLEINQARNFNMTFTLCNDDALETPINLTDYTAKMQIRKFVEDTVIVKELSTTSGNIILGGALGTIVLNLSALETETFINTYVYDLELISLTNEKETLIKGIINVIPAVTR